MTPATDTPTAQQTDRAKIIIDGTETECRTGVPVLQAALEAGLNVPHYCYHPGLSVVASCRLCLMEMKLPHPKTGDMDWGPKMFPSCQTPVRDGMEVRFNSEMVQENQRYCMEFFLINHPLDCPVCDQAGECHLQDYSERFGNATSRMIDQKTKGPKKNIGPATLLYTDRCVMCTRCVRFTQEVSGTNELCVINRGAMDQIDVFPGIPLDNKLQGNVVDICPVGALLDKDFLFKQRVWLLRSTDSICPGCATGCAIRLDANDDGLWRIKPRYNPKVNDHWICDEGRFGWKYIESENRITHAAVRRGAAFEPLEWDQVPHVVNFRLQNAVQTHGGDKLGALLSPMMSCEEAWLLATLVRKLAPQATLAMGPVPIIDHDECFPVGCQPDQARFTISNEKCPNRRGIEMILEALAGTVLSCQNFIKAIEDGNLKAAWIAGGYPHEWPDKDLLKPLAKLDLLILQDLMRTELIDHADLVLPFCAWTERQGCFVNNRGLIQPFAKARPAPQGAQRDGQYLFEIAGHRGLYSAPRVREMIAEKIPAFSQVYSTPPVPRHQH